MDQGYAVDYISPVNEPQWHWSTNAQEGSPWRASEIHRVYVELDRALESRGLNNVKMLFGEAADLKFFYEEGSQEHWKHVPREERPNLLAQKYFDPESPLALTGLKHLPRLIGGHAYHSELNPELMKQVRERLRAVCDRYGLEYQQTEWCLLPFFTRRQLALFTENWTGGNRADIQTALLLGRIVYADFAYANATAWGYWKGMEIEGNHALISLYPRGGNITNGGMVAANKLLWALGNYSLFVRPGYRRVELRGADDLHTTAGLAFLAPDGKRLVAVFVNSSFDAFDLTVILPEGLRQHVKEVRAFRTDANIDLGNLRVKKEGSLTLAPRSLTTIVYDLM